MPKEADSALKDQLEFDWVGHRREHTAPVKLEKYLMFEAPVNESAFERSLRMLEQVKRACMACTMCELGRRGATRDGKIVRDPHVFSNMNPTRFVVVGQNPGWNEVEQCIPFVGQAGVNFDAELAVNGLSRNDLYICNTVRCYTDSNSKPTHKHVQRCEPFLRIEINVIRPLLVATLGSVAFDRLCPGKSYQTALGTITESDIYEDVPVFAIYHPSPLNLQDVERAKAFKKQMRLFCGLVKKLQEREKRSGR